MNWLIAWELMALITSVASTLWIYSELDDDRGGVDPLSLIVLCVLSWCLNQLLWPFTLYLLVLWGDIQSLDDFFG